MGFCGREGLCFGGSAVLFGFSCGLGFVVAMAWFVVLVLGVCSILERHVCKGLVGVRVDDIGGSDSEWECKVRV